MRVICVIKLTNYSGSKPFYTSPEVGERCTVVKTIDNDSMPSHVGYALSEYEGFIYDSRAFATLPSTTEEVAIEAEQEALIYQR